MLNVKTLGIAALLVAAALAGCTSSGTRTRSDGAGDTTGTTGYEGDGIAAGTAQIGAGSAAADAALAAERSLTSNVIYFDFDMTEIRPEYQGIVDSFAAFLVANPSAKVTLEGHADEQGTREYNVGLGERRAQAVQSALLAKGASPQQLNVLSYGEERPADLGHDDAAWAKNRRVQLIRQ